jgi:KTSC domain-containing protein
MPSSVIRHFKYDPARRALQIKFVTGKVYLYLNVPGDVFEQFSLAPSKGRFFNEHIRDRYAFAPLGREPLAANDNES